MTAKTRKILWIAVAAALAVAVACRWCRPAPEAAGSEAAPAVDRSPTIQEEVAERMADPVYSAQLDDLAEAQRQLQLRRAELGARLEACTRGKTPAEYEQDPEFQSLKRRLADLDQAFAEERQRAIDTIHNRISK